MPEFRQNVLLKDWVIISTERAKRPEQLKEDRDISHIDIPKHDPDCPFCPGNEEKDEYYRENDNEGNWKVRVVPNRYPAVTWGEGDIQVNTEGFFRWMDGIGQHEVVIESPSHHLNLATMDTQTIYTSLLAQQRRLNELMKIEEVEYVILFRNHGLRAGASLLHPHSQIVALPVIPRDIMARMNESIRYFEEHRHCIFCRMLESEMETRERVVVESPYFVAFVPYAANSPFRLWIFPCRHRSSFGHVDEEELKDLAAVLKSVMGKLYYGVNNPDYNLLIRSAPKGYDSSHFFHWYVSIVPRLTRTAGFELGSGMFINPSIPEENAAYLRDIRI